MWKFSRLRVPVAMLAAGYLVLTLQALTCVMAGPSPSQAGPHSQADTAKTAMAAMMSGAHAHHGGNGAPANGAHLGLCACLDKLTPATVSTVADAGTYFGVLLATLPAPDAAPAATPGHRPGAPRAPPVSALA